MNFTGENLFLIALGGFYVWLTFQRDFKMRGGSEPATPFTRWGFRVIGLMVLAKGVIQMLETKQ